MVITFSISSVHSSFVRAFCCQETHCLPSILTPLNLPYHDNTRFASLYELCRIIKLRLHVICGMVEFFQTS
ncbi:hypothetical protein BJ875DRAFT_58710 [Amylocarpus encephaloides]|uniref:Uncharacterized protein n=1 Tax=Amylocarpus encephaloides TaxID=45428 RepID=A0A9P8C434_9HELO|nr:hypothetical protein BJ875DRAFT_58710 [Amylocarpus encephaloides]